MPRPLSTHMRMCRGEQGRPLAQAGSFTSQFNPHFPQCPQRTRRGPPTAQSAIRQGAAAFRESSRPFLELSGGRLETPTAAQTIPTRRRRPLRIAHASRAPRAGCTDGRFLLVQSRRQRDALVSGRSGRRRIPGRGEESRGALSVLSQETTRCDRFPRDILPGFSWSLYIIQYCIS